MCAMFKPRFSVLFCWRRCLRQSKPGFLAHTRKSDVSTWYSRGWTTFAAQPIGRPVHARFCSKACLCQYLPVRSCQLVCTSAMSIARRFWYSGRQAVPASQPIGLSVIAHPCQSQLACSNACQYVLASSRACVLVSLRLLAYEPASS